MHRQHLLNIFRTPPPLGAFFVVVFCHLYGGVNGPEVDGLEDIAVQLGGLVRLERQSHLDERVREPLFFFIHKKDDEPKRQPARKMAENKKQKIGTKAKNKQMPR